MEPNFVPWLAHDNMRQQVMSSVNTTGTGWPMVPLGDVIQQRKEFIEIDDFETYKRCRVQLHAKGVVLRDWIEGYKLKTKKQQVCQAGELLVAEIDAKVGGFGLVPDELQGAIVSSHYFLFVIDETVLDRRFLDYFIRTPDFQSQVSAQGSTNYASIRPQQVLDYEIPLPSLKEQRRIVARIEELAAKVEAARALRQQATEETEALVGATFREVFLDLRDDPDCEHTKLGNVAKLQRGRFSHRPRNDPVFFGGRHPWIQIGEIESAGKYITKHTETLNDAGLAISRKFQRGTLLISIAATIGAIGILGFDCCIPDSVVAVMPDEQWATSEFLYYYLAYVRGYLEEIAPQSAQKNINLKILNPLPISLPQLAEQRRIVAYLDDLQAKVDAVKEHQAATAAALDALLPSILDRAFKGEL
jgi:type I restriction enzyme S subunit